MSTCDRKSWQSIARRYGPTFMLMTMAGNVGCAARQQRESMTVSAFTADNPASAGVNSREEFQMTAEMAGSALDFTVEDIDGNRVPLAKYRGKVILIVNVASKCGFTSQYEDLQQLHDRFASKGLAILGFPSNDFLWQEPGTNDQIKRFCRVNFGVQFDMFAKVSVKGRETCELYRYLTSKKSNPHFGGGIRWNFTKFLLGRDGEVINRFGPTARPSAPEVQEAIQEALKQSS